LIVAELPPAELQRRLDGPGLRVRMGPLAVSVRAPIRRIRAAMALHYGAHEVLDGGTFADFDIRIAPPRGLRRFLRPTVIFHVDEVPTLQPLPAEQAFPLLEWGINWCIATQCHWFLMLHSAVVERAGGALLLPAPPGAGKSTLCAALVARGWRLLSDEMALIDLGRLDVTPIPRPISLKNRAIDVIRDFWPGASIGAIVHETLKGSVAHARPPAASVARDREAVAVRWIVLPQYVEGAATSLTHVSRGTAFMRLVDSAFNYTMHGRAGFETLAAVVERAECFEFRYGGDLDAAMRCFDALADAG
jgi:HprK-related kinase A